MRSALIVLLSVALLSACSMSQRQGTLAELQDVELELKDETVEDGLEKAMASYQRFLEETPESAMTPEAIRRIADLTVEKEYGYIDDGGTSGTPPATTAAAPSPTSSPSSGKLAKPAPGGSGVAPAGGGTEPAPVTGVIADTGDESEADFEQRTVQAETPGGENAQDYTLQHPDGDAALENADARKAVELYKELLRKYPLYERNDQVLYQMSRAYENLGEVDKAMEVIEQLIEAYPNSRYIDEVQFRRAEYFFTRKKFLDSEEAYQAVVSMGPSSNYYELALYKLGWSFYKQELYEDALHRYIALLDHKVSVGYDFDQETNKGEKKRIEDTFRVISLSFSNLGGPEEVASYFEREGNRDYEDKVYSHLGEFYLQKRRYNDAAESYKTFIALYPFSEVSPHFNMRVIDIYKQGGFGKLVVEAKKSFATTYALDAEYWHYFEVAERPDVVGFLKGNLKDLANHYHALYQDKRFAKDKGKHYAEALLWYRNYLSSFPREEETPGIHFQMAELMLENKDYGQAAVAYERTAYNYPLHEKSSAAGYAAVYAHREHLNVVPEGEKPRVQQSIIKSSLKFADTYPEHEKVTIVIGAAADDLYEMKNYELAIKTAYKLIDNYPDAELSLRRSAWLVVAHASFSSSLYAEAENGYLNVLQLTEKSDKSYSELTENLAASIYKQGEQANLLEDYNAAAEHFLRVGRLAPKSKIRPTADYDAAAALIQLKAWERAAGVLLAFRSNYPGHELQHDVTKKIAFVYREDGKLELAAAEYERIERESDDEQVRRGSLMIAAELYAETGSLRKELAVYERYVEYFPRPVETAIETYNKIANAYQSLGEDGNYMDTLKQIVAMDESAGEGRTDRTRYLAAQAALVLTEPLFERFTAVRLVAPIKPNILKKKEYMQEAVKAYSGLTRYEVADVTAAATYYIAEIYLDFSVALKTSERPDDLTPLQREQYELALEDQIYPFEEKAIGVHEKNIELLHADVYSIWIDKSIARLARLFPAIYARDEVDSSVVATIDSFHYMAVEPKVQEGTAAGGSAGNGETTVSAPAAETTAVAEGETEAEAAPVVDEVPVDDTAPAVEAVVAEDAAPAAEEVVAEDTAPAVEAAPTAEPTPAVEAALEAESASEDEEAQAAAVETVPLAEFEAKTAQEEETVPEPDVAQESNAVTETDVVPEEDESEAPASSDGANTTESASGEEG